MKFTNDDYKREPALVLGLAALDATDANLVRTYHEYQRIVRSPKGWVLEALRAEARRRGLTL